MTNVKSNKSPKSLSKPKKIKATLIMKEEGHNNAEIAEFLGISESTAKRYAKLTPQDKLTEFEPEFRNYLKVMQFDGLGKVHKRLNELIPNERRISEVVRAGEFLEGKRNDTNIQVNTAVQFTEEQLARLLQDD